MTNLYNWHSKDRINDYKKYVKNNNDDTQIEQLYWLNQRLSVFIYHLIANCELALRNKINNYLIKQYGNDWYNNVTCIENDIIKAKDKLKRDKKTETNGRIVSELSFGTWTAILNYYKEQKDYNFYTNIFYLSKAINSNKLTDAIDKFYGKSESLRILRNKCVHHENIIKNLDKLKQDYASLIDILQKIHGKKYRAITLKEVNKSYKIDNSDKNIIFDNFIKEIFTIYK